ncbi:MAG: GHKL domain-containing protein [Stenotrophomonas nitritireducens]|uniref:ATP-binding protein n=1 Tax=Stenotrophomonas sp. Leaf70 TaxID=1736233 RepID=UPI00128F0E29|nr:MULTISPECIES: ATP-binding protein [Stenotrophomonas]MBN8791681.1 GHKL domain-containing protein [Stenotrophomonas nitritireducens]MBN8795619.1 GHKL domain-containing protein [Stenotrophomonas nitritireducens]
MYGRLWFFRRWRPRSLQARQLLAASVGLVAFLALAGYALDAAFAGTARANLSERLKNYATSYAAGIDFTRDRSLYIREQPPDPRFDVPGSGLYLQVVMPGHSGNSMSAEGPILPDVSARMLEPREETFEGPLPITQIDGTPGEVYRYGMGLVWGGDGTPETEFPYTIYVLEDSRALGKQLRVFRSAVWFWLGVTGLILLLLQTLVLQWSLRPLKRVINELTRVQRGERERMSEMHPRELEPLTDSINAFIESERENLERQRNTLADLAHSLKTPIAVLRTQLDSGAGDGALREELDVQLQRMNNLVSYQLARAASSGHKLFSAPVPIEATAEDIVPGLEKIYASKGVLCEFELEPGVNFYGEPGDLQELMGNLLENAFKWARRRVLLTARSIPCAPGRRAGLVLAVDDDGPGIAEENIAKVLQRGVRGDERVQGHGIGLSIVQDLIKDYRGELQVKRSPELGGARFEVTLPPGL